MTKMGSFLKRCMFSRHLTRSIRYYSIPVSEVPLALHPYLLARDAVKEDFLINRKLTCNENFTDKDWEDIYAEIESKVKNTEVLIMDICKMFEKNEEAFNFIKFLKKREKPLSLAVLLKYLYLLSQLKPMPEEMENEIINIYEQLRQKYEVFTPDLCEKCILAICRTSQWKNSFKLLEEFKLSTPVSPSAINAIIAAAFNNNEPEIGWKLLEEAVKEKVQILSISYLAYLEYCLQNFDKNQLETELLKIFAFWREHMFEVQKSVMNEYTRIFERFGYESTFSYVPRAGRCGSCQLKLQSIHLTTDEFKELSYNVLNTLIIGQNVYYNTSPEELKNYMSFVQYMKPYDVVVDGLNVAYAKVDSNRRGSLQNVIDCVHWLKSQKLKRVLVIGRVHMNWWSNTQMFQLRRMAEVYLVKNLSEDDPFLLHLTMLSGPQTYFVSRDLMRQHRCLLDTRVARLFRRWQLSRQIFVVHNKSTNKMLLTPAVSYDPSAQEDEKGWHVPYHLDDGPNPKDYWNKMYDVIGSKTWVCMRKK